MANSLKCPCHSSEQDSRCRGNDAGNIRHSRRRHGIQKFTEIAPNVLRYFFLNYEKKNADSSYR